MPKYRVKVVVQDVVIDASDEEEAYFKAERILTDASAGNPMNLWEMEIEEAEDESASI